MAAFFLSFRYRKPLMAHKNVNSKILPVLSSLLTIEKKVGRDTPSYQQGLPTEVQGASYRALKPESGWVVEEDAAPKANIWCIPRRTSEPALMEFCEWPDKVKRESESFYIIWIFLLFCFWDSILHCCFSWPVIHFCSIGWLQIHDSPLPLQCFRYRRDSCWKPVFSKVILLEHWWYGALNKMEFHG